MFSPTLGFFGSRFKVTQNHRNWYRSYARVCDFLIFFHCKYAYRLLFPTHNDVLVENLHFSPFSLTQSRLKPSQAGSPKGPFIATQLNSTQLHSTSSWVELRRWSVYSDADATQLNSTDLLSVALPIVGNSWVASVRVSIATQLNSTRRRVELSCVAIKGP